MIDPNFYRAFEERHRGSRELIKSRLEVYLPFILPLKQFDRDCQGIDLGCGRGEWLELMQENGINIQGVDLDQGMLDAARERGLNVSQGDAIQTLQSLALESQMLVSGFHLAEHLPFEALKTLIDESLRVLKPGGLMILETPNPENIVVGTANFYLDPTHQQPIPLQLLSFMAEYSGFAKVKVVRLQESIGIAENNALTLMRVLNGVSPDYAVVAQKNGASEIIAATATAFKIEYGISLESLADNFDQQVSTKIQQAEAKAEQAEAKAEQAEAKAQQAEAKAEQAEAKAQQAEAKAQQAEVTLITIHNTLRIVGRTAKCVFLLRLLKAIKSKGKEKIKLWLKHAKLYVNRRPKLRQVALAVLTKFPALKNLISQATIYESSGQIAQLSVAPELANLTPRARRIYADLKAASHNHSKKNS